MDEQQPNPLVERVIEEAKTQIGTWSCASIRSIESELSKLHQKKIDQFVHELLEIAASPDTDNNLKLKIAQLLSSLRSFFMPGVQVTLKGSEELVTKVIQNIGEGRLSEATKRMYSNLTKDVHIISAIPKRSTGRIKSSSVQPGSRSTVNLLKNDSLLSYGNRDSKERLL